MARAPARPPLPSATTPPPISGTPAIYPGNSYDFTLQVVIEMQKSLGELTQAVKSLCEDQRELKKTVDYHGKVIYAALALGSVLGALFLWLLNRSVDAMIQAFARK